MSYALPIVLTLLVAVSQLVENPEDLGRDFARAQKLLASADFEGARRAYEALLAVEDRALLKASKVQVVVDEEAVGLQAAARYQLANLERRRAKLLREEADLAGAATADSLETVAVRRLRIAAEGFAGLRDDTGFELRERAAYMLMDCLFEARDHEGVTAAGEALLRLFPSGKYALRARYTLGWSYFELARYGECIAAFTAFLDQRPESILADRARLQRGLAWEELGKLDDALAAFTSLGQAYDPASMSYEEKTQVALAGLREGTSRQSIAAKAWLKRGDVLKAQGDAEGALAAYRRVPEGFPQEERLAEMAWVRQALLAADTDGPERAAEVYRHAVEASTRPGFQARMMAGEMSAWFDAQDYAEALEGHRAYLAAYFDEAGRAKGAAIVDESGVSADEAWFQVGECLRLLADEPGSDAADSLRREAAAAYGRVVALAGEAPAAADRVPGLAADALFWRGYVREQVGEADSARADYGRVRLRYPGTQVACEATLQLARLERQAGAGSREALLREMLTTCGDEEVRGFAALELARLYRAESRLDAAREVLAGVAEGNSQYPRARLELARVLLRAGDEEAARTVLGQELARLGEAPDDPDAQALAGQMQAQLGLVHQRHGDHAQALGLLRRGLPKVDAAARAEVRFAIGWSLYEQKRYEEAWSEWTATLDEEEVVSDDARARLLRGIGLCAGVLGRADEAVALFSRVAEAPGGEAEGRLALGQLHLDGGRPAAAVEVLRALLEGDRAPAVRTRARLLTAKARLAQDRYAEALALVDGAHRTELPSDEEADLHYTRGSAAMGLGDYTEAAEAFGQAAEVAAEGSVEATALYYRAQALWAGDKVPAAREAFARLARDFADEGRAAEAAFTVAELHYGEGDYEAAAAWYGRVHERWPDSEQAPKALYGAAWCRLELGDGAGMDSLFLALAQRYPHDEPAVEGLMNRADSYYNSDAYEQAAGAYAEVVERYPDSPQAQDAEDLLVYLRDREADAGYQKAMALYDAQEYEPAVAALARIVELYPGTASEAAARCNIGMAYQHMAEYRRAMETYDAAIEALEGRADAEDALAFARQNMAWIRTNVLGETVQ